MERRNFLKSTLAGAAAIGVSSVAYSSSFSDILGERAPSNKVKVALLGCRGMGWSNLVAYLRNPEVECVSLCDIDDEWLNRRAADVERSAGKKPPQLVKDWRRVIDNKDVDVVIIGTPDHWHCLQTIAACEAGKDVYVEKPLANSIEECNLMVKALKKYNSIVQVGQWQRSDPHWDAAAAFVKNGNLGRVRTVKVWAYQTNKPTLPVVADAAPPPGVDYNMWLGPAPLRPYNENRFHYNFRFFWDYAGGLMSDWGVHLLDYALEAMNVGLPTYVFGAGGKYAYPTDAMETPDTLMATYKYPDFNIIWDHACGIANAMFDRREGLAFYGENGTLILTRDGWEVRPENTNRGRIFPYCFPCDPEPTPVTQRMQPVEWTRGAGGGLNRHVENHLECIKSRRQPNCNIEIGAQVANLCHIANISSRLGVGLQWNNKTNSFVGNRDANRLIKPVYRAPWKLPKV